MCSCNQNEPKHGLNGVSKDTLVPFFPVTDFILGQLREIDNLPVTPLKITIVGPKQDSEWLKREDIRVLASPFLHPVIDSISLINLYSGKSFLDQTVNAFTFSYDVKARLPDSIKLIHWDVYIDPVKNTVQRVYMVKEDTVNRHHVTSQFTWESNKWFSIRTIEESPASEPHVKEMMVKWDFNN